MYDSRATLVTRLTEIRAAIAKVRTSQYYTVGKSSNQRANYKALLEEEKYVLDQINVIDNSATGGATNRVRFNNA